MLFQLRGNLDFPDFVEKSFITLTTEHPFLISQQIGNVANSKSRKFACTKPFKLVAFILFNECIRFVAVSVKYFENNHLPYLYCYRARILAGVIDSSFHCNLRVII